MYTDNVKSGTVYDLGLRNFMLSVLTNMSIGLGISGLVALLVGTNPAIFTAFFGGPQAFVVILAPIALVFFITYKMPSMSVESARLWFFIYAAVMGLSLSTIFVVYKISSIATIFFASAAMFGCFAIYGATTKRDLTKLGGFFIMGLMGVILASLINLFLVNSLLTTMLSVISVVIFAGLTAYDIQQLQNIYDSTISEEDTAKYGVLGALTLYLNFINIFLNLLQLFGEKE